MNIYKHKIKSIIGDVYINIYIILSLLYQQQMLGDKAQGIIVLYSIPLFIYMFFRTTNNNKLEYKYIIFILFILMFIIFNSLFIRGEILIGAILSTLITSTLAYIIYIKKIYYKSVYLIPFIFFTVYILERISEVILPSLVFVNSRNYISFVLIVSIIPYYFLKFKNGDKTSDKIKYLPAVLTFLISAYALGRSGVFSSFLILSAAIIYGSQKFRFKKIFVLVLASLFIITFIYYLISIDSQTEIERFNNLEDGGRAEIIYNIIQENHLYNYIFGFNPNDLFAYRYWGHLHSSILNLFSVIGVMTIIYFIGVIKVMLLLYKENNYALIILFIAFYLRISTDVAIGFGFMDYILWFPILILTIENKNA